VPEEQIESDSPDIGVAIESFIVGQIPSQVKKIRKFIQKKTKSSS